MALSNAAQLVVSVRLMSTLLFPDAKVSKSRYQSYQLHAADVCELCLYCTALAKHTAYLLVFLKPGSLP